MLQDNGGLVALSVDGKFIASGREPVHLRELVSGKELARFDFFEVRGLSFAPHGRSLAIGYDTDHSNIYQVPNGERLTHFGFPYNQPLAMLSLGFSPDGATLASVQTQLGVNFLNIERGSGKRSRYCWDTTHGATAVAYSPDGKTLAIGWQHGISLWDVASAKERFRFPGHEQVFAVLFSPDGTTLTARYGDGTALIWRTKD